MKTIDKLTLTGYEVKTLNFTFQGIRIKRKGYAILKDGIEIFTLEPKNYPKDSIYGKDKWFLSCKDLSARLVTGYFQNINQIVKYILNN